MARLKVFSPAKINLFLKILSRRPDGYHTIETLFERIDLGDTITLRSLPSGIKLRTNARGIPKDASNLVVRAAELLQRQTHVQKGVEITLQKRIPVSAGLGGGSSNAAAVLLGLNRLWKMGLSRSQLLKLGSWLGSDVPFFILGTPYAVGRGRGEKLAPVRGIRRKLWHCIVKPRFGISTRGAYQAYAAARLTPPKVDVKMLVRSLQGNKRKAFSDHLTNSLELALNKRLTNIQSIKKKLVLNGASGALLSGSGSAVFGLFDTEREARRAAKILKKSNKSWQVFVARTY